MSYTPIANKTFGEITTESTEQLNQFSSDFWIYILLISGIAIGLILIIRFIHNLTKF